MSNLDNDDLYRDEETTGSTAPLAAPEDEETLEEAYEPTTSSTRPAGNKVFIIALGVLAAVFIISIIAMIIFASISLPRQQQAQTQTAFAISMGNDATITAATATQEALVLSQAQTEEALNATATEIPPTATEAKPTATEKVVEPTEEEVEVMGGEEEAADADPALTATTGALLTLVAQQATETAAAEQAVTPNAAQMTATAQAEFNAAAAAAAELPDTGFMDGGGLYATAGAALVLVLVILVVRKLRKG